MPSRLPANEAPDRETGVCCRLGLALAAGSALVALGGLLFEGAAVLAIVGLLGASSAFLVYCLAGRGRGRVARGSEEQQPPHVEELGRMKDTFLSTISHELRTPLTNICAYTEILLNLVPGDEEEWPEFLRIVQDESQHLTRLVDSVMEYVRLENDQVEFANEKVDLGTVARCAADLCRGRADSSDIELCIHIEPELAPVSSDGARLTQVLMHLLDNALKFTPGGGRVEMRIFPQGPSAVVLVDDSGPGIRPEHREGAFDRFAQLRDHLTSKPDGTGLGLATVRLLLTRLGGTIRCEESPLGGARFRCELPFQGRSVEDVPAPPAGGARAGVHTD